MRRACRMRSSSLSTIRREGCTQARMQTTSALRSIVSWSGSPRMPRRTSSIGRLRMARALPTAWTAREHRSSNAKGSWARSSTRRCRPTTAPPAWASALTERSRAGIPHSSGTRGGKVIRNDPSRDPDHLDQVESTKMFKVSQSAKVSVWIRAALLQLSTGEANPCLADQKSHRSFAWKRRSLRGASAFHCGWRNSDSAIRPPPQRKKQPKGGSTGSFH